MKHILFIILALWFSCELAWSQNVVHDYVTISYRPHQNVRELYIDASGHERQVIDLRAASGKGLSAVSKDVQTVYDKVQEFESQDWVLLSFNCLGYHIEEKWIWVMRKPKR